jgi:hypothetical protein
MAGFGISTVKLHILQGVPGFKVSTAVFDSRGNLESDMSCICGSDLQLSQNYGYLQ